MYPHIEPYPSKTGTVSTIAFGDISMWCSHTGGCTVSKSYPFVEPYPAANILPLHVGACSDCMYELRQAGLSSDEISELALESLLYGDRAELWKRWDEDWENGDFGQALWNLSSGFLKSRGYHLTLETSGSRVSFIHTKGRKLACARTSAGEQVSIRSVPAHGSDELWILKKLTSAGIQELETNHTCPITELLSYTPEFCLDAEDERAFVVMPVLQENWLYYERVLRKWSPRDTDNLKPFVSATITVGDCLDLALQCIEGLFFMHSLDIAHCDIHLRNIMYRPESARPSGVKWFFIDFEMSQYFRAGEERLTWNGIQNGGFDPPERRIWDVTEDCFAPFDPFLDDVYATGMFLYYCVQSPNQRTIVDAACPALRPLIDEMAHRDFRTRITAETALMRLRTKIRKTLVQEYLQTIVPFPVVDILLHPEDVTFCLDLHSKFQPSIEGADLLNHSPADEHKLDKV